MSKGILIVDEISENCLQCQFAVTSEENNSVFCTAAQKDIAESWLDLASAEWDPENCKHPDWCPLKYLPDAYDMTDGRFEYDRYCKGWNDCLDEIGEK